jgi:hypothetical protein
MKASASNDVDVAKVRPPQVADHGISDENVWLGIIKRPVPGVYHTPEAATKPRKVSQNSAHLEHTP